MGSKIRYLSLLREVETFQKLDILDEIFGLGNSVMPEHQLVEKSGKIAKRFILDYYYFP